MRTLVDVWPLMRSGEPEHGWTVTLVFRDDQAGFVRETVRFACTQDAAHFRFLRVCELQTRSPQRR